MSRYFNHVLNQWLEDPEDEPAVRPAGITTWVNGALACLALELEEDLARGAALCLAPGQEAGTPLVEIRERVERQVEVPAGLPMAYQVDSIPPELWARIKASGIGGQSPGAVPFLIVATPLVARKN
jgi:hypothetical protein